MINMIKNIYKRIRLYFQKLAIGEHMYVMTSVYNINMVYVGDMKTAKILHKRGIVPEPIPWDGVEDYKESRVCQIGWSEKNQKYYGWSHRAICGFKIGDEVKEGDCCTSSGFVEEYIKEHPEKDKSLPVGFIARTKEDCKRMAIAFANSVS